MGHPYAVARRRKSHAAGTGRCRSGTGIDCICKSLAQATLEVESSRLVKPLISQVPLTEWAGSGLFPWYPALGVQ